MGHRILVAVAPHVGGAAAGTAVARALHGAGEATVVESLAEAAGALATAHVLVTALVPVTAGDLAGAPDLELIQCATHGYEHVDLRAAARRGIPVCNIGSSGAEQHTVPEQTFALLLALAKQIVPAHTAITRGEWPFARLQPSMTELHGKSLGVIGMGRIGREVARLARAFGMDVAYTARTAPEHPVDAATGARYLNLEELLRTSDVITLHAPLNETTRHLLNAERLALLKPTAFVINTGRGGLIDQEALADCLDAGAIAGAGLDVFDPEPPPADLRLLSSPRVVLSPHAGGGAREVLGRIVQATAANVLRHFDGQVPADRVDDPVAPEVSGAAPARRAVTIPLELD